LYLNYKKVNGEEMHSVGGNYNNKKNKKNTSVVSITSLPPATLIAYFNSYLQSKDLQIVLLILIH
jgi:hypothetical protein